MPACVLKLQSRSNLRPSILLLSTNLFDGQTEIFLLRKLLIFSKELFQSN